MRDDREVLAAGDFDEARDRIILGRREGSNVLLRRGEARSRVHESGHALVAAYSDKADPIAKVTILPAGQSLGVTEQLPLVERHLYGEDYLYDTLVGLPRGPRQRAGRPRPGLDRREQRPGQGDRSCHQDGAGVRTSSDAVGPVGYPSGGSVFLDGGGPEFSSSRPFAEETQAAIDLEVARLLREAEERAIGILKEHRDVLDKVVELLLAQRDRRRLGGLRTRRPSPAGGTNTRRCRARSATARP